MKLKHIIIILLIAAALTIGYVYFKKVKDAGDSLRPEYDHFRPTDSGWALKALMGGFTAEIGFKLTNFSTSKFTVNQIKIDCYTLDDVLIASPVKPMTNKIVIEPNSQPVANLDYFISKEGVVKLLESVGMDISAWAGVGVNYLKYNKLGLKIKIKGFVQAEGISILKIPIEEIIDI